MTQFVAIGNLPLQAYELFLGSGCPVSYRDQDIFVFFYILSSCGIRVHVRAFTLTNNIFFDKPMTKKNQATEI